MNKWDKEVKEALKSGEEFKTAKEALDVFDWEYVGDIVGENDTIEIWRYKKTGYYIKIPKELSDQIKNETSNS